MANEKVLEKLKQIVEATKKATEAAKAVKAEIERLKGEQ